MSCLCLSTMLLPLQKNLLNSAVMVSSFLMKVMQQTYLQKFYNNDPVVAYGVNRDIPYQIIYVYHSEAMIMAIKALVDQGIYHIDYIDDIYTNDTRQIAKKYAIAQYCNEHKIDYRIIDSTSLNAIETESSVKQF